MRYGELATELNAHGIALHNLGSLPHISVAGAIATATHGSGDANGNLATAVVALELVTAGGELRTVARGEDDFDGMVVGLGALGAVTRVTLDVEPFYEIRQRVYEDLTWDALHEHFDAITGLAYSVSLFTLWDEARAASGSRRATSRRTRSSARVPPTASVTRSPAWIRSTARASRACPAPGRTACRTSRWASRRARGRRSSPST